MKEFPNCVTETINDNMPEKYWWTGRVAINLEFVKIYKKKKQYTRATAVLDIDITSTLMNGLCMSLY